jgi:hypothetical protein
MPYPLDGHFAVEDSARLITHYRYAAERMMRVLGGWLALTPELSAKLLMGRHVWDTAQHADAFGKRLPELRAHAQTSDPASPDFVGFMDALESPEGHAQTVERLVGMYRVLKPHLLATYERHLRTANAVYEPPTRRILARCIEDEQRHVVAGAAVIAHLARSPELRARAAAWQRELDERLCAARGVTGDELSAPGGIPVTAMPEGRSDEAEEFIRLETGVTRWPIPDDLMGAVRAFADGLVAGDPVTVERWLTPGLAWPEDARAAIDEARPSASRIVACARLGAQRLVKLRLDRPGTSVALATRWAPRPDGWRVEAVEVARVEAARPA